MSCQPLQLGDDFVSAIVNADQSLRFVLNGSSANRTLPARFISEEESASLVDHAMAFDAAREALIAAGLPRGKTAGMVAAGNLFETWAIDTALRSLGADTLAAPPAAATGRQ